MTWLSSMTRDGLDGSVSSKRVVTLAAFVLCAIAFLCNLFLGLKIEQFIFDSMSYIAMAGLGATVAEKFSSRPATFTPQPIAVPPITQPINTTQRIHGTPLPYQEDPPR